MSISYLTSAFKYIVIPAFSVSGITDVKNISNTKTTASYVVKKYFYTVTGNISFPRILIKPSGADFIPVLWWIDGSDNVQRRKLWVDDSVSLYATLYTGEKLPNSFAIEIWPQDDASEIVFLGMQLETSHIITPAVGCPSNISIADTYSYELGTDPLMDVDTYTWSGVDGDYWTVDSLGYTTFVDLPTVVPPTPVLTWGTHSVAYDELTWVYDGPDPDYFQVQDKRNQAPPYDWQPSATFDGDGGLAYTAPDYLIPGNLRVAWTRFYEDFTPPDQYNVRIIAIVDAIQYGDPSNELAANDRT